MGGSVMLMMEPGEAQKVKAILDKAASEERLHAPILESQPHPACFWADVVDENELHLGYSFGLGYVNGEWADAVAIEIIKRFKVLKAGWDSIGYCDELKGVLEARPFQANIEENGIVGLLMPKKKLLKWQKAYEEAAAKIFEEAS